MSDEEIMDILGLVFALFIIILVIILYFLPTIVAFIRKHSNRLAIFFLNLFTGCTGLGWVAAFVWAFIDKPIVKIQGTPTVAQELKELAELKEQGIITEEEFQIKKNKLLEE